MNSNVIQNENPEIFSRTPDRIFTEEDFKRGSLQIDAREIFDHIRDIKDPEHPMTLEELNVVELDLVKVSDEGNHCYVEFRPTIPHCSMATLIGLAIKVQLTAILPVRFKIDVCIVPGTHVSAAAINKQLADKERVDAALENIHLRTVIADCLLYDEPQTLPSFVAEALEKSEKACNSKVVYIRHSRQFIESYRRWKDILSDVKWNDKFYKIMISNLL